MILGKPGVRGNPPAALADPTAVVTDPTNGDTYVGESHTDVTDPNLVGRISVFDKTGRFLPVIGKTGSGSGEFRTPHALAFDSQSRLVVADRHNHRIQVLSKSGKFILEYDTFGRTSGLAIDKNDVICTTGSESTEKVHPGWQRRNPRRKSQRGESDDFHSAAHDAEFFRRRYGERHCGGRRWQHLFGPKRN